MLKILEFTPANYKDSVLTKFCGNLAENKEAFKIGKEMIAIMQEANGMGLAANQVGLLIPLIIVTLKNKPTILYRPTISFLAKTSEIATEGCLSFPGIFVDVKRPTSVKFSAIINKSGKRKEFNLEALEARCFLHEYSHITGKTILCEGL